MQMGLLVGVLCYLLWVLAADAGGMSAMLLMPEDRLMALDFAHHGLGDGQDFAFWPMLIGGFFLYVSYYGCDQSQVQRQLCAANQRDRQSPAAQWPSAIPLVLLYCLIGWVLPPTTSHADFLPALPESNGTPNANMALPLLFLLELPDGLKGVAIVGVMAAAMSSLDSVINSLSAVTMEDFVKRCHWASMDSELAEIRWSKALTAFWGLLAIVLAFWVDDIASTVLVAVNKLGSLINGPLLAVFVMGLLTERATGLGVKVGFAVGFMSNGALWLGAPGVSWLWWNVSGFLVAVVVGLAVSSRAVTGSSRSDAVWSMVLLRSEGFDGRWVMRYIALALAAIGFWATLASLGA